MIIQQPERKHTVFMIFLSSLWIFFYVIDELSLGSYCANKTVENKEDKEMTLSKNY